MLREYLKSAFYFALHTIRGGSDGRVLVRTRTGPAKSLTFRLDLLRRKESAYWLGYYDKAILETLDAIIKPEHVIWECGVYLGYYTCFFARRVKPGNLFAFEPDPHNLARADAHLKLNGLEARILPFAIGRPEKGVEFIVSENSNSHLPDGYIGASRKEYDKTMMNGETVLVDCYGLDESLAIPGLLPPDIIKIDIEGAEFFAMDYMQEMVREIRPIIVLELHNPECDLKAWDFFRLNNYRITRAESSQPIECAQDCFGTLLLLPN